MIAVIAFALGAACVPEWEVVKAMPEGTDDVVLFSKGAADKALRGEIEKEYPGLLAQHGGVIR